MKAPKYTDLTRYRNGYVKSDKTDVAETFARIRTEMDDNRQQQQQEREQQLEDALNECLKKGVSKEAMKTLLYETGARWIPEDAQRRAA